MNGRPMTYERSTGSRGGIGSVRAAMRIGLRALLACAAPALVACDLEDLLDVEVPGAVPEDALSDPELANTLVASVIADLECAWDDYTAVSAIHSDEFIPASGNVFNKRVANREITGDFTLLTNSCDGAYGLFTPLQTARFVAEDVFRRLGEFTDEEVPNRTGLQSTVRAYGGYALLALGEGFCEVTVDGGPLLTPDEVLQLAETRFTEALDLAGPAGMTDIESLARAGRARARLDREDFAGAAADAALVPEGFEYNALRDGNDSRRFNTHDEFVNSTRFKHASVADHYRAVEFGGVPDPRVSVATLGELSFDFTTIHWFHDKTSGRDTPTPLASYKEAQLVLAEAAARTGDLATARTIINERHTLAGLPAFDGGGSATQDEVIAHVIEERRRELFVEGGHRLNDMLRFRGTPFEIPFLGEPGSIHPDGLDQTQSPYGTATCYPIPSDERFGNPNVGGD